VDRVAALETCDGLLEGSAAWDNRFLSVPDLLLPNSISSTYAG
jgi:hypothetical protein